MSVGRFPSVEAATVWHAGPGSEALAAIRHRTASATLVVIDGIA